MTSIYRYQTPIWRSSLDLQNQEGEIASTDLCTIDGWRYVSVNDNAVPDPDVQIEPVTLTAELRAQIKSLSPHCQLIKKRAWERLAKRYSQADQAALDKKMSAAALGVYALSDAEQSVIADYVQAAQEANQWAAQQYAELGL